jgi:putative chitinase
VAAWYWTGHHLNDPADRGDFAACTRAINGGLNGQASRLTYLARARSALGVA